MLAAIISALAAVIASAGAILLTKRKERDAVWRGKKLAYYEDFLGAASGIVGDGPSTEARRRFATAVNNLHLIASKEVLWALHAFTDATADGKGAALSREQHDVLWSRLVWEIRADLGDPPSKSPDIFRARLWSSGGAIS